MSYFLRKSVRKRGLYLQIYESHYCKERKKTVTRFVMTIGYHEDLKKIHRDPVDHGLSLVRAMNFDLPRKSRGKPRRADIDNARFVDIVRPLELLRRAMGGEEALPQFQERLSLISHVAAEDDEEGRNMRRIMSRLWESHDSLLRGLTRMSHEAGFFGKITEAKLFPLIPAEGANFLIMTDQSFFPIAILDSEMMYESRFYQRNIKAELPDVSSYVFYGPLPAYGSIPEKARKSFPILRKDPEGEEDALTLSSILEKAREMVERVLPQQSQAPSNAKAYFTFFATLLMAYQDKHREMSDAPY